MTNLYKEDKTFKNKNYPEKGLAKGEFENKLHIFKLYFRKYGFIGGKICGMRF